MTARSADRDAETIRRQRSRLKRLKAQVSDAMERSEDMLREITLLRSHVEVLCEINKELRRREGGDR